MGGPNRDGWRLATGLAYPVVAFVLLVGVDPLAFHPPTVALPAVALAAAAIVVRLGGVRMWWVSIAAFVTWLTAVVYAQWLVMFAASAAV